MKKEIIRINNLSYKVKDGDEEKMLLNNISISFEMPEIITISGPSGSGKTTFLYAISGMLDNLKGEIYIEEKNILACTKKEREKIRLNDISIIFQNDLHINYQFHLQIHYCHFRFLILFLVHNMYLNPILYH
jgi:ABC-type lipoprotein export system ATPase subunit